MKKANAERKKELGDIRERLRIQDMMKEYVTTRRCLLSSHETRYPETWYPEE
jgi:hypothetical protein